MPPLEQYMVMNIMVKYGKWEGDLRTSEEITELAWGRLQMEKFNQRGDEIAPATYDLWVQMPTGPEKAAYLAAHPEIEEVIFTGGDPLILSDDKLDGWLSALGALPHVKWVRFHTRVPVVLPERLTPELAALFKRHRTRFDGILLVVHTNVAEEWDGHARARIREFRDGVEWLSQSVLLREVNDNVAALETLLRQLVADGVRPYYLHHPDDVRGGRHFCLSRDEGAALYRTLRQRLPGWALPQYVVETPAGGGKEPAFQAR
jgi:lysine 2,3-aminomutase